MNGRVYDPLLGRFGTPDPMTENPFSTQGWNRYSYVGNSPVNFTDPSGYCFMGCFWKPMFAAIGRFFRQSWRALAQLGATTLLCAGAGPLAPVCAGVVAFAVTGVTSGDLGLAMRAGITAFATAFAFKVVGDLTGNFNGVLDPSRGGHGPLLPGSDAHMFNIAGHALVGCGSSVAQGGRCGPGALSGAIGSAVGPFMRGQSFGFRVVSNAVLGGIGSAAAGGNFGHGALTAAFGYLFNETFSLGGRVEYPAVVARFFEWLLGRPAYAPIPNALEVGVTIQYPTLREPHVSWDAGGYVQFGFGHSLSAVELSGSFEMGVTKGDFDTARGVAMDVGAMVGGIGGSVTITTDNKSLDVIGANLSIGSGVGGSLTTQRTFICGARELTCR
jgi:hypothetical protein